MVRSKNSGWMPDWAAPLLITTLFIGGISFTVYYLFERQKVASREEITSGEALPAEATDLTDVGNGWYEFTYKNKRYLYHSSKAGYGAQECIVQIEKRQEQGY